MSTKLTERDQSKWLWHTAMRIATSSRSSTLHSKTVSKEKSQTQSSNSLITPDGTHAHIHACTRSCVHTTHTLSDSLSPISHSTFTSNNEAVQRASCFHCFPHICNLTARGLLFLENFVYWG